MIIGKKGNNDLEMEQISILFKMENYFNLITIMVNLLKMKLKLLIWVNKGLFIMGKHFNK